MKRHVEWHATGALQEGATYVAYKVQKDRARGAGDKVLEAIFHFVRRDEAAHGGFYRAIIELEPRTATARSPIWPMFFRLSKCQAMT